MPFEKKINTPHGTIGIWNLNESSEILLEQCSLSTVEEEKFNTFIIERRKKEFLASRIILQNLLDKNQEIEYSQEGKPHLKSKIHNISISHSADFACLFFSDKNIGIDIEQTTRNIDRVATRFLHSKELEFIDTTNNPQHTKILFWAAKEAIFKCAEDVGIQYNEQIFIEPFQLKNEGDCNGYLQLEQKKVNFKLHYFFIENNVLVYCVEE